MFYCSLAQEEHRDFLRFMWFRDNNPKNEVVQYRMRDPCVWEQPITCGGNLRVKESSTGRREGLWQGHLSVHQDRLIC